MRPHLPVLRTALTALARARRRSSAAIARAEAARAWTARPLLSPDEAMRLAAHLQALLRPNRMPALVAKLRHYVDREFAGLADG
jgi:type IV secretory pathway TraG/TraD family ATPase VirD4